MEAARSVAAVARAAAPFLELLAEEEWLHFVGQLEAYRARGGKTPLKV